MEYREYNCTPKRIRPARRRRRPRGRRRAAPLFLFAALLVMPVIALLTPHIRPLAAEAPEPEADRLEQTASRTPAHIPAVIIEADSPEADSGPPAAEPEPEPAAPYDFSMPVPESDPVDKSFFADAVLIGDSRTEGLVLNTGLSNAAAYAFKGLMVDTAFTKPVVNLDGQKLTVMEALEQTDFSKVYIMLGINETGWAYSQVFARKYGELIDGVRAVNPEAVIYIQGLMPVSKQVSAGHSYLKNDRISEYNSLLRELAEEKQVYYIDTENAVAAGDGSLPEEAASDGIHLVKAYCEQWLEYLKTHTVSE